MRAFAQLGQLGLDVLDFIGGPVCRTGYPEGFIAVIVAILARLADGFLGGCGCVAAPRVEGGELRDSVRGFRRRFSATAGGVEDLADITGVPAVDVGN